MRMLTVVCVVLGSVPLLATPAPARPTTCPPVSFTAQADASLLKLSLLDLRPLGLATNVANLTLAPTKARMVSTAAVRSSAEAHYLDASVLGLALPRGPLEARVAQQAPPSAQSPTRNTALAVDLGAAKVGTGTLEAHARWTDPMTCGTQAGPAADATAALADATVLPGSSGPLLRASQNLQSRTATALVAKNNRAASAARAEIGLSKLDLIGNTVTLRVLRQPSLHVTATGHESTTTVDYQAPLLEITAPGLGTKRLETPGQSLDIPLPTTGLPSLLSNLPLNLAPPSTRLRLTLGTPTSTITSREVTASVTTLRLELLTTLTSTSSLTFTSPITLSSTNTNPTSAQTSAHAHASTHAQFSAPARTFAQARTSANAMTSTRSTVLLDLSVGLLSASATAPHLVTSPTSPPACGTPHCTLPVTGLNLGIAVGTGILILILGRFFLLLTTARRSRPSPAPHP